MPDLLIRALVLLLIIAALWLITWQARAFVERRRRAALNASAADDLPFDTDARNAAVRILAFSSADCRQCHTLQEPALQRLLALRGDTVAVREIDAPSAPDLTQRYHVLTVPTTVVLDATGRARAVNYGFANTQKLLSQVDEALGKSAAHAQ